MIQNTDNFLMIEEKKYKSKRNEDGALIITKAMKKALKMAGMKENKGCFYIAYNGNKRSENGFLIPYLNLDGINKIIEPFCGSSAFSRFIYANYGEKYEYFSNDKDAGLISLLKDIKQTGCKKYFKFTNERLKGLTKEKHKQYIQEYKNDIINPYNYFYYNKIYNFRPGLFPVRLVDKTHDWTKYLNLDKFYTICNLSCMDYLAYMEQYKNDEGALVYIDPPYFDSCNSFYSCIDRVDDDMNIVDNTYMFVYFINYLRNAKCKIIFITNHNSLLVELYKPWIKLVYNKTYSSSHKYNNKNKNNQKRKTKHMIVTNI